MGNARQSNSECRCLNASSGRRKTVDSSQQIFRNASIWRRLWKVNAGACNCRMNFPLISSGLMVLLQSVMLPNNSLFGKFTSVQQIKDKILQSIKLFWTYSLHMRIPTWILPRDVCTTAPPNQPTPCLPFGAEVKSTPERNSVAVSLWSWAEGLAG